MSRKKPEPPEWMEGLVRDKRTTKPIASAENITLALRNDINLDGLFWMEAATRTVWFIGQYPSHEEEWWSGQLEFWERQRDRFEEYTPYHTTLISTYLIQSLHFMPVDYALIWNEVWKIASENIFTHGEVVAPSFIWWTDKEARAA